VIHDDMPYDPIRHQGQGEAWKLQKWPISVLSPPLVCM